MTDATDLDLSATMQKTWGFRPPRSYVEMHRAQLFEYPATARNQWPPWIRSWTASGEPKRVLNVVFEMDSAEQLAQNDFVTEMLVPGLVPFGGDGSGDVWCFDTRRRIHGTTPVIHVPHDGGGGVYLAPSFAAFVYYLILENLQYFHFYESWKLSREDMNATTRRSAEAAAPWLLERWKRKIEKVVSSDRWPDHRTLPKLLARDPAFAELPRGEQDDVFRS